VNPHPARYARHPLLIGEGLGVRVLVLLVMAFFCFASTPAEQNSILSQVRFDQKLQAPLPLDAKFRDENGHQRLLGRYLHGKPAILNLVYFQCPMLCTETLNGLTRALRSLSWTAGKEFQVLTVSFDPKETSMLAHAKKRNYLERYGRPGVENGWSFLTGDNEAIQRLTHAVGFGYAWDANLKQFAHPTGLVILTPDGRVSSYLFGAEYPARDLRLALTEAGAGKIGTPVDRLLLTCYHYDPLTGRYNFEIFRLLQLGAVLTMAGLGIYVVRSVRTVTRRV
jgi:protein SCO1/2